MLGIEDGGGDAWWKDAAKQNPRKTSMDFISANGDFTIALSKNLL